MMMQAKPRQRFKQYKDLIRGIIRKKCLCVLWFITLERSFVSHKVRMLWWCRLSLWWSEWDQSLVQNTPDQVKDMVVKDHINRKLSCLFLPLSLFKFEFNKFDTRFSWALCMHIFYAYVIMIWQLCNKRNKHRYFSMTYLFIWNLCKRIDKMFDELFVLPCLQR